MKLSALLLPILIALSLALPQPTQAQEEILRYHVNLNVFPDAKVQITEEIDYYFGTNQRHGIFREIPYIISDKNGNKFMLDIKVGEVYAHSPHNRDLVPYETYYSDENLIIKIGDPNKTISGARNYYISYEVKGSISYFEDHDELYWNVIGTNWTVPISGASVALDFSKLTQDQNVIDNIEVICFTGPDSSTSQDCGVIKGDQRYNIVPNNQLQPNEGLTFAASFPKGLVEIYEPKPYKSWSGISLRTWIIIVANVVLSMGIFLLWFLRGRDPSNKKIILRMYDSPKDDRGQELSPLELGTVVDEKIHPRDISAEIINLAIKKYLVIEDIEHDILKIVKIRNTKLMKGPMLIDDPKMNGLKPHQKELLRAFEVHEKEEVYLKDLKVSLPSRIQTLQKNLYEKLTADGYFKSNPQTVRMVYLGIGFALSFVWLYLPSVLMVVFSFFMPRRTEKGVEAKRHGLGLKQFLDSQDRQFEFQEKNLYMFEKLLPYAISFGVAKIWASKFNDLYDYMPEWYSSNTMTSFNTTSFTRDLETNLGSFQSNYSASTSKSGFSGGSSGGGGGGGGGGSW